jgi:signal transduction histidine kinase
VLATADATRRRIQRDLHDGAQQRLVQATVVLELAERAIAEGSDSAGPLVREALDHTRRAAGDLHDLVRGIMPQALVRGGIHGGIRALVEEVALPVEVRADVPRTAPELETAVYFVVAEALTNTVKHAEATRASVDVALTDADVTVSVRDDGRGGARLGAGSGLVGLQDRVAALGGSLALDSSPGEGTHLSVVLPQPGSANGSR